MMRAVAGVRRRLCADGHDAVMVAMIHDELNLETGNQGSDAVATLLAEEMTTAFSATFPDAPIGGLVDVKIGPSWSSLK